MSIGFAPPGYNTVSPYLMVSSVAKALAFVTTTFQAVELCRMEAEKRRITHAEVRIGDSVLMLGERDSSALPASTHVYVPDVEVAYRLALIAGATSLSEPRHLAYGDRSAGVRDTQGNLWWLGTHLGTATRSD